jgi:diadenosine tetraphosphate (Ap4A) HIT family hydrolase
MANQKLHNLDCPFCTDPGGELLFEEAICRVVLVGGEEGKAFPGFCRVICNRHVREMGDLSAAEQRRLLDVVLATERAVRAVQHPDKMNLASLGNVVPHVHWHIIPRWKDDSHFPGSIWSAAQRVGAARARVDATTLRETLAEALKSN